MRSIEAPVKLISALSETRTGDLPITSRCINAE
jgi:hypothetical protein